jgi:uroporphyrinogen-III synthase
LAGKRVLVTRALHQAGKLSDGLRALGAVPVEVPVLEIGPPASFESLDQALRQFQKYDWLLLTSANTVRALFERAKELGIPLTQPVTMKVASVGEATASAARKLGLQLAVIPEKFVAESLSERLLAELKDQSRAAKVLYARAAGAREVIPQALQAAGIDLDVVDAYQNRVPKTAAEELRRALASGIDMVTFTSSSSVTHLSQVALQAKVAWPFAAVPAVSIGPITSQTLRDSGWPPAAEAEPSDIPGLLAALMRLASHSHKNLS